MSLTRAVASLPAVNKTSIVGWTSIAYTALK